MNSEMHFRDLCKSKMCENTANAFKYIYLWISARDIIQIFCALEIHLSTYNIKWELFVCALDILIVDRESSLHMNP